MYTCGFLINANLVKEGSFCINAKLVNNLYILNNILHGLVSNMGHNGVADNNDM